MTTKSRKASDCYSERERRWMDHGRDVRQYLFAPILPPLRRMGVTADHITIVAGLLGVAFLPLWLLNLQVAAFCSLALHIILDGLDGPLARYDGSASAKGSFTDSFTDQIVVTAVTIAWMATSPSPFNIGLGASYIFLYAIVVAFAIARNALEIPYSWLLRPRFIVYTAMLLEPIAPAPLVVITMFAGVCLLGLKTFTGFLALRRKL